MTKMELQGSENGCFPMDKDTGIEACRKYRADLEAKGYRTWLEWFAGDLFIVRKEAAK